MDEEVPHRRPPGRPKGSKDRKPRRRKTLPHSGEAGETENEMDPSNQSEPPIPQNHSATEMALGWDADQSANKSFPASGLPSRVTKSSQQATHSFDSGVRSPGWWTGHLGGGSVPSPSAAALSVAPPPSTDLGASLCLAGLGWPGTLPAAMELMPDFRGHPAGTHPASEMERASTHQPIEHGWPFGGVRPPEMWPRSAPHHLPFGMSFAWPPPAAITGGGGNLYLPAAGGGEGPGGLVGHGSGWAMPRGPLQQPLLQPLPPQLHPLPQLHQLQREHLQRPGLLPSHPPQPFSQVLPDLTGRPPPSSLSGTWSAGRGPVPP